MVFSYVNGNKLTNVRYSKTPVGEKFTDSNMLMGCYPESQN